MKHTHATEDYANKSHKKLETVFTKFKRATYFSFNFNQNFNFKFKIETSSAMNSFALLGHLMMIIYQNMLWIKTVKILCCIVMEVYIDKIIA
jgi:hypothetical protein